MFKLIIIIVISLFLIMCSANKDVKFITLKYLVNNNDIVYNIKNVSYPVIVYEKFGAFFQKNSNLDMDNITLNVIILENGEVNSAVLNCENKLPDQTKEEIINNVKTWKFEPAKYKSGLEVTSLITINWSDIYSQWKSLLIHPEIPKEYKFERLYSYNPKKLIPKPIKMVPPEYPNSVKVNGIAGDVYLYAHILTDGSVDNVIISKSLNPLLDSSCVNAIKQWKFEPIVSLEGKRIPVWVYFPVSFRLD